MTLSVEWRKMALMPNFSDADASFGATTPDLSAAEAPRFFRSAIISAPASSAHFPAFFFDAAGE